MLDYSLNNVVYLFSQGEVLHVVNGPFSSEALGFTFRLNDSTEIQRWKSRLVRSLRTQLCMSFMGNIFCFLFK